MLCHLVIRLVSPHGCEQGLGWRTRGKGFSGLVPAVGEAIHTTQVQVDEATVIRLSPIVYNKEVVKTELLGKTTLLPPRPKSYQTHGTYKTGRNIMKEPSGAAGKRACL